jgi:uncharacterized delta-60 repeat protein
MITLGLTTGLALTVAAGGAAWGAWSADGSFSGDGLDVQSFSESDMGVAVAQDAANGRVYVAVDGGIDTTRILAYSSGGALDSGFSGDGIVELDLYTVTDIEVLGGGKLVLAGQVTAKTPGRVVRLTSNGALDTQFSGDGIVPLPYELQGVDVDSKGRAVTAGTLIKELAPGSRKTDFGVARIRPNGTLDDTFSGDGKATLNSDVVDDVTDVTVDSSDRPIVVGASSSGTFAQEWKGLVARWKVGGAIDGSFSGDGEATATLSKGQNTAVAVGTAANDRVLVAMTNQEKFGAVRFLARGTLDTGYSGDGKVAGNHEGSVYAAVIDSGAVLLTGAGGAGFDQVLLAGVTKAGALDTSIGTGGKTTYDFTDKQDFGWAVSVDSSSRVLIAGQTVDSAGTDSDAFVVRLSSAA